MNSHQRRKLRRKWERLTGVACDDEAARWEEYLEVSGKRLVRRAREGRRWGLRRSPRRADELVVPF